MYLCWVVCIEDETESDVKSDQSLGSNFVKKTSNPEILEIQRTNLKTRPNVPLKTKMFQNWDFKNLKNWSQDWTQGSIKN